MKRFKFKHRIMAIDKGSFVKSVFLIYLYIEEDSPFSLTWCPGREGSIVVVSC
jgi:hypothetical protein